MDMQQIIEMLKTNQAKADTNRKAYREDLKEMKDNQAKTDKTLKEMLAKWEAERKADVENLKSMMERMMVKAQTEVKFKELTEIVETTHWEYEEPTSADMKACQGKTEACLQEEPASEDMTSEVAHEPEVPVEDAGGRTEEKASGLTISGCTAPPEEGTETDPEEGWVLKEFGGSPPCSSSMA
jgi:hypothetical protein